MSSNWHRHYWRKCLIQDWLISSRRWKLWFYLCLASETIKTLILILLPWPLNDLTHLPLAHSSTSVWPDATLMNCWTEGSTTSTKGWAPIIFNPHYIRSVARHALISHTIWITRIQVRAIINKRSHGFPFSVRPVESHVRYDIVGCALASWLSHCGDWSIDGAIFIRKSMSYIVSKLVEPKSRQKLS